MTNLANTFLKKKNIKIVKAKDIFLYSQNKKFVDLTGGYTGHAILGWGNKAIINAIKKQSQKYCHIPIMSVCIVKFFLAYLLLIFAIIVILFTKQVNNDRPIMSMRTPLTQVNPLPYSEH